MKAMTNTNTNPTSGGSGSITIYLLDGSVVVMSYADLWSGGGVSASFGVNEQGVRMSPRRVWTGTSASGATLNPLGTSNPTVADPGNWGSTNLFTAPNINQYSVIALSDPITCTGAGPPLSPLSGSLASPVVVSVPEPSTLCALAVGLIAPGLVRRGRAQRDGPAGHAVSA